jgi:glycosyltransferase involved in cell wall biosynthesis
MLLGLFQALKSKRESENRAFSNLALYARRNRKFLIAVRNILPKCEPEDVGKLLLERINYFVANRDFGLLTSLIDVLRPFLNADQSSAAWKFWEALAADCRLVTEERLQAGRMSSLWGVTPIVSLKVAVAADRALKVNAHSLVFDTYYISSDFDFVLSQVQARLMAERAQDWISFRWIMLIWALANFDIFHLYNDRGIIAPTGGYGNPHFGIAVTEMKIYRKAKKRLYTYAYGADHRLRKKTLALGTWTFCSECPEPGKFCLCDDDGGGAMLEVIRQYSTAVIAHGLAMKIIPGARNIPYLAVDADKLRPRTDRSINQDQFVVGHFPNHPYFKGSNYLEKAILKLQSEGYNILLLKLGGKPNSEILEAMGEIDVLVDQLVSGSFGLTAVEAMALGCPVICYLHNGVDIAEPESCPIIPANPDTIEDVLRSLLLDRERLRHARKMGPLYVRRNYSTQSLARHLAELYRDTADLPQNLLSVIETKIEALTSQN